MFGIGNRVHSHGELPEPPYSVDVVADLHAGVYPDDYAELLKPRVLADPDAHAVWTALEATSAQLAELPDPSIPLPRFAPLPPFVQERIDQTLRELAEQDSSADQVTWLSRHRVGVVSLVAAAAVAGIAVATTFAFTGDSHDPDSTPIATPSSPAPTGPEPGFPAATLLSVLGNTDGGGFVDRNAQDLCLQANQISASTTVLGSGSVDNAGDRAVVILLATGTIGTFDALVVGADCTTGNPSTISRTTIGDK